MTMGLITEEMVIVAALVAIPIAACILFMWIDQKWQAWLRRRGDQWDTEKHCVK